MPYDLPDNFYNPCDCPDVCLCDKREEIEDAPIEIAPGVYQYGDVIVPSLQHIIETGFDG